jgi:hypothetical protein
MPVIFEERLKSEYLAMINSSAWEDLISKLQAEIQKQKDLFFNPDFTRNPADHRLLVMGMEMLKKKMILITNNYKLKQKGK